MKRTIVWKDHDNLAEKYPKAGETINRLALQTMRATVDHVEDQVVGRTPVGATGKLRQGWATEIHGRGVMIWGRVANPVPYGMQVEIGRESGKLDKQERKSLRLGVIRKLGVSAKASKSVTFLIARHIEEFGTDGQFMLREGVKKAMPQVRRLWKALPDKITKALGK
jgi:hypothetical protein